MGALLCVALVACEPSSAPVKPCDCPNGCCDAAGVCHETLSNAYCGIGGQRCVACGENEQCDLLRGQCVLGGYNDNLSTCNPTICAHGCCLYGQCQPGTTPQACGVGGQACQVCSNGQQCVNGVCKTVECSTNCPGCCDSFGNCQLGLSEGGCGLGGVPCQICAQGQVCQAGQCQVPHLSCNAQNCPNSCCNVQGQCEPQPGAQACGTGGAPCRQCAAGQACINGRCTCTPQSCPNGCCEGDVCRIGGGMEACGTGGAPCQRCSPGQICNQSGRCETPTVCNARTCDQGCCQGNTCMRPGAENRMACGVGGAPCQQCWANETCTFGTCNDPQMCAPWNCPHGCCVEGRCVMGNSNQACGALGEVCIRCRDYQTCQQGTCKSDPHSGWGIKVTLVEVDPNIIYDLDLSPPDLYVKLSVGTIAGPMPARTPIAHNTYRAEDFGGPIMTATARELTSQGLHFSVMDSDLFWDETIAACSFMVLDRDLSVGSRMIVGCPGSNPAQWTALRKIRFEFVASGMP